MTAHTTLRVGSYMGWERRIYRITALSLGPPQTLTLEDAQSLEPRTVPLTEILFVADAADTAVFGPTEESVRHLLTQQTASPQPTHAGGLPPTLLTRADGIIATVVAVERAVAQMQRTARERGEDFSRVAALDQALSALPLHAATPTEAQQVGRQTYYRYLHRYRLFAGGRSAIAASLHRKTLHQSRMSPAILHLLDLLILRYYARERPMRPQTLYHLLGDVLTRTGGRWIDPATCGSAGVPEDLVSELLNPKVPIAAILLHPEKAPHLVTVTAPSRSWFYGYLRYFENSPDRGEAVITARYGHETWEREHLIFDSFVRQASLPLQYVFADHWLVDAFIVDEATRRGLDRLWLTLLIDAYSRCILGMALLYEAPSIMSLQTALRHAIWPKPEQPTWSCYGIPMQLFLDNAWAHHSHSVEDLARQISADGQYLSIDLVFRPPYKGRYGAIIERLFGTLSGRMKEHLPGAIQNSSYRAVNNAQNQACLLYRDLEQFLLGEIVAYQHRPHSELGGMTPEEKWREGLRLGLPVVPPLTTAMERLFWREDPDPRYLHDKGISSFGLNYWSATLAGCPRRDAGGSHIPYLRRYHPDNISTIAIFRGDTYVGDASAQRLRLPDGTYRAVSLSEREMARALVAPGARGTDNWVDHLAKLDDQATQRTEERRQATKRPSPAAAPQPSAAAMDAARERALALQDDLYTDLLQQLHQGGGTR